jgi:hypothetical protein
MTQILFRHFIKKVFHIRFLSKLNLFRFSQNQSTLQKIRLFTFNLRGYITIKTKKYLSLLYNIWQNNF